MSTLPDSLPDLPLSLSSGEILVPVILTRAAQRHYLSLELLIFSQVSPSLDC